MRKQVLALGAGILEQYLEMALQEEKPPICAEKHLPCAMRGDGKRSKQIVSILGQVRVRRARFVCPSCGKVLYCADEMLGVAGTGFSPGARRLMAVLGASESLARGPGCSA